MSCDVAANLSGLKVYLLKLAPCFLIGYQTRFLTLVNQLATCRSCKPVFWASIRFESSLMYGLSACLMNHCLRIAACSRVKFDFLMPRRGGNYLAGLSQPIPMLLRLYESSGLPV